MKWILAACAAALAAVASAQTTPEAPEKKASDSASNASASAPAKIQETVVVSATRGPEIETEIPGEATVVTGEELRRRNVKTVAEALQDIVGVDSGLGDDNGSHLGAIGLWGLKEFDALLVMVDGVPVGGPFNPSLSQINVDDVDHIEIVKGPQGTLYGVSAFAGMIQIFTREAGEGTHATVSGGSFSHGRVAASTNLPLGGSRLRVAGNIDRSKGWQDRTDYKDDRLSLRLDNPLPSGGKLDVTFNTLRNTSFWGSPLPVDHGQVVPGFQSDRNYAVDGARLDHRVHALAANLEMPLNSALLLQNTLSLTRDDQISVRSFLNGIDGNMATAEGIALRPTEDSVYDDLHVVANFEAAGHHRLVGGAALTWGRTRASGYGFDVEVQIDPVIVPDLSSVPAGDHRSFVDRRTFAGFYVNDEWTPLDFLTITAGARYDRVSESLFAKQQEVGDPSADTAKDNRTDGQWSGGVSVLGRLIGDRTGAANEINVYASAKSAFKPAAPNLSEAENAKILEPERSRSGEVGIKTRWLDRQLSFDASLFHMMFENLVVPNQTPGGAPELVNAGEERFQGAELSVGYSPKALRDVTLSAGYAHHDARFVRFSFTTPDGEFVTVNGNRLELVPRDLWNFSASFHPSRGLGAWMALRHQNRRPLSRRNTSWTPAFEEWDAGVSYTLPAGRLSLTGRNLGDSRHYTAESEIGDSQFYVAPPRRFLAEWTMSF
jgi:iron complex outermembrane receptor protein